MCLGLQGWGGRGVCHHPRPWMACRVRRPEGWAHGWRQLPPNFLSLLQDQGFLDSLLGSLEQCAQDTHFEGPSHKHCRQAAQQQLGIKRTHHSVSFPTLSLHNPMARCPGAPDQSVAGHEDSLMKPTGHGSICAQIVRTSKCFWSGWELEAKRGHYYPFDLTGPLAVQNPRL